MKASIIVSDVDSQGTLLPCIHAICTQDYADKYEVILTDCGNFSKEDKALLTDIEKRYPHLRVLRCPGKNRAALVNEAVKQSYGKILCFIESHCHPDRIWLKRYAELFQKENIQAAAGGVQSVPSDSIVFMAQDNFFYAVRKRLKRYKVNDYYFDFHNSALTRKCFDAMGGFAEELPFGAEFEMGARLHQKGINIRKFPSNSSWHFNENKLINYSRIISGQGKDRTRIRIMHGEDFSSRYFPNPKFDMLIPVLKHARLPAMALLKGFVYLGMGAVVVCSALRFRKGAQVAFRFFAECSSRYGMVSTLNEFNQLKR